MSAEKDLARAGSIDMTLAPSAKNVVSGMGILGYGTHERSEAEIRLECAKLAVALRLGDHTDLDVVDVARELFDFVKGD